MSNQPQAFAKPQGGAVDGSLPNEWKTDMCTSCCSEPMTCLVGYIFPWCCVCMQRKKLLEDDMTRYHCCAGMCGESHTEKCDKCTDGKGSCCLCLESIFCLGCAIQGNRHLIRSEYSLDEEYCDRFLQWLPCLCYIAYCITGNQLYKQIGNIVYYIVVGCMLAQHEHQMVTFGFPHSGVVRQIQVAPMT
jgi:hypothetical protein